MYIFERFLDLLLPRRTLVMAEPRIRRATEDDAEDISNVIAEVIKSPEPVAIQAMTPEEVATRIRRIGDQGGIFICRMPVT